MGVINGQNQNALLAKRMKKITAEERPIVAAKKPENTAIVAKIERVLFTYRETLAYYHELLEQYEEASAEQFEGKTIDYEAIESSFEEGILQLRSCVEAMEKKLEAIPTAVTVDTSAVSELLTRYETMLAHYQENYAQLEAKLHQKLDESMQMPQVTAEITEEQIEAVGDRVGTHLGEITATMGQYVDTVAMKVENQVGAIAATVVNQVGSLSQVVENQTDAIAASVEGRVEAVVTNAVASQTGAIAAGVESKVANVGTVVANAVGKQAEAIVSGVENKVGETVSNVMEGQMGLLVNVVEGQVDSIVNKVEDQVTLLGATVGNRINTVGLTVGNQINTMEASVAQKLTSIEEAVYQQFNTMGEDVSAKLSSMEAMLQQMKEEKEEIERQASAVDVAESEEAVSEPLINGGMDHYAYFETGEHLYGNMNGQGFGNAQPAVVDTTYLEELLEKYRSTLDEYKYYLTNQKASDSLQSVPADNRSEESMGLLQEYKQALAYYKDCLLQYEAKIESYDEMQPAAVSVAAAVTGQGFEGNEESIAQMTMDLVSIKGSLHVLSDQITILSEREASVEPVGSMYGSMPAQPQEDINVVKDEIGMLQRKIEDLMKFVGRLDASIIDAVKADSSTNMQNVLNKLNELSEGQDSTIKGLKPIMVFNLLLGLVNVGGIAIVILHILGLLKF